MVSLYKGIEPSCETELIMKVIIVALFLVLFMALNSLATMYGTGKVSFVDKNFIAINGANYRIHNKIHVGSYQQRGTNVVEIPRSIRDVERGQEVRFKSVGNLVLELIILKR